MTCRFPLSVLALLALSASVAAKDARQDGEAELAKMLEGRVAGAPVDCIRDYPSDSLQVIDGTAMVFSRGDTIYVNRPPGVERLDEWDLPVIRKWNGNELCRQDRVDLADRYSLIPGPVLLLAEFVPYTRQKPRGD